MRRLLRHRARRRPGCVLCRAPCSDPVSSTPWRAPGDRPRSEPTSPDRRSGWQPFCGSCAWSLQAPEFVADGAPEPAEVVRITQRARGGGEDEILLTEVWQGAALGQRLDREPGQREGPMTGGRLGLVHADQSLAGLPDDFAGDGDRARVRIEVKRFRSDIASA